LGAVNGPDHGGSEPPRKVRADHNRRIKQKREERAEDAACAEVFAEDALLERAVEAPAHNQ
jgi:hypothetical protein